ncbi:hypothetical protein [Oscillatoria sp. FACHB-1406]|uniref:hypothetical protein n=1 Tax=Oscillatoria sp. FACHB-1406 TaxID=2692846 RepID=UPI00168425BE|nr:hypothetical protein [Oscillatoria sp. FACHB-1406]MBD2580547.1 hypothetical protein [Oscillatoria sp. FACHB-1406]
MNSSKRQINLPDDFQEIFYISPLIRLTLLAFYAALTLPLPFLAKVTAAPIPLTVIAIAILLGAIALFAALSERTILNSETIRVAYPAWTMPWFRKGWTLRWREIEDLKLRTTGQGGLVYYFVTSARDRAYLLPARIAGFARMLSIVEAKTGIETRDIRSLSQPWMYFILLGVTAMLLLVDVWTIATAFSLGKIV